MTMTRFKWVTNRDYALFCIATGHKKPAYWIKGKIPAGTGAFPVTVVLVADADAYCLWAKTRLPTAKEAVKMDATRPPNLWEWTSTIDGSNRVLRGGSWFLGSRNLRSSIRLWLDPTYRFEFSGFRCASHPKPKK